LGATALPTISDPMPTSFPSPPIKAAPLDDLDNENLKYRVHFREIYASIAREWWGVQAGFIKEKPLGLFV
jgi:hypothetical protein